ncbi:MAG: isoprenylcysteine carboxylmethyltransferase family protein [Spirochaetes bacterium]|nr:isoprenylcysteine carboxylmethyltransferase family protein [Spirochaetota bacterium]
MKYLKMFFLYIFSISIFLGIPFIINYQHLNDFFADKINLFYFLSVLILSIPSVIIIPFQGKTSDQGLKKIKCHKISLFMLQFLPLLIIICSALFENFNYFILTKSFIPGLVGNILFLIGFSLMNYSAYILGKQFNVNVTIIKDHQLIVNGPYSLLRHPRYLGILLTFSGIPLIFNTYMPLLFSLLILIVLLWRIRDEEILLDQTFKEQWTKYKTNSKKLIPFIW